MTSQDFCLGKAVRILWEDSALAEGWHTDAKAQAGKIVTIGWVVDNNGGAIAVSGSINDQWSCIAPLSIPWSCIVRVEEMGDEWNRNGE